MSEEQKPTPPAGDQPQKPEGTSKPAATPAQPAATPAAKPATARPVAAKPATPAARPAVKAGAPASPARREFMVNWLKIAWTFFAAATAFALGSMGRFLFPNVLFEPKMSFKIGKPSDYEVGNVDLRWKEKYGIWVVRNTENIYILSTVCTHLGCTPSWLEGEQKFKCPCHGSGFYKSGIHFEGPAPRPLERFAVSLADDGQLLVDKSKKFQYEKGEWTNPLSFVMF